MVTMRSVKEKCKSIAAGWLVAGCVALAAGGCAASASGGAAATAAPALPAADGAPRQESAPAVAPTIARTTPPLASAPSASIPPPTVTPTAAATVIPTVTVTAALTAALALSPTAALTVTAISTPAVALLLPTVTPAPTATEPGATATVAPLPDAEPYRFSPLYEGLVAAYPASFRNGRFVLHYTPGTLPEQNPQALAELVTAALSHHEQLLGVALEGSFDVYAAGALFAAPDQALRGRSFSAARRTFFLHDGSGSPADQVYIAAHELTHLFAWNTLGAPSSTMLSEGLAVFAGMHFVAATQPEGGLLPLQDFCAAYQQAGALPHVAQDLAYLGHIRNLENYYSAGCFVQFLIEQYGAPAFGQVYPSGDYLGVYAKSLPELEAEWLAHLAPQPGSLAHPAGELVAAVAQVERAYQDLFVDFWGSPAQLDAYRSLDRARVALLMGRLEEVQAYFGP